MKKKDAKRSVEKERGFLIMIGVVLIVLIALCAMFVSQRNQKKSSLLDTSMLNQRVERK